MLRKSHCDTFSGLWFPFLTRPATPVRVEETKTNDCQQTPSCWRLLEEIINLAMEWADLTVRVEVLLLVGRVLQVGADELSEGAVAGDELLVGADLGHAAPVQHDDAVDSRQIRDAVRHEHPRLNKQWRVQQ